MTTETPFYREIREQPDALGLCAGRYDSGEDAAMLKKAAGMLASSRRIIVTGMGTSLYAPYLWELELADVPVTVVRRDASELLHFGMSSIRGGDCVVAISQSGESAETRRVVEGIGGKAKIIAIVNNPESSIARAADVVLPLHAGCEASISTKTYTNTLAILYLVSSAIKGQDAGKTAGELQAVADIMRSSLPETSDCAAEAASAFEGVTALHCIARGRDFITALQWALIVKEGASVFSEALTSGLFRHGPIELAGNVHDAAFIVSRGCKPELTLGLAEETARYGSRVLVVTDGRTNMPDCCLSSVLETHSDPRYFPLLCAPFIECFVHETAKLKGCQAGIFRHAGKITDRE